MISQSSLETLRRIASDDQVAVIGTRGYADLCLGTNNYVHRYFEEPHRGQSQRLAESLVAIRAYALSQSQAAFVVCVPNKASCLWDNYPIDLPQHPTPLFQQLRSCLQAFPEYVFCDWMLEGSFADRSRMWFRYDSHWNSRAARLACDRLLAQLGLREPTAYVQQTATFGGDLSGRWLPKEYLSEDLAHEVSLVEVKVDFDNAQGNRYSGNSGRMVKWRCESARVPLSMLVVGDSFSGTGHSPWNLTYWLSRAFRETTFLHSFELPEDLFEVVKADVVLYQTNERFIRSEVRVGGHLSSLLRDFRAKAQEDPT